MSRADLFRAGFPALAAGLVLAACEDGPTRPGDRDPADLAAATVHGGAQAGTVGRALADSVVVQVTDRGGAPVRGLELEWRVLAGGGEVLRTTTTTGRDGRSGNVWVLGTRAGEQQVEVRALLGSGPAVLDTVRASAAADAPAELRLAGDSVRAVGVGDTVRLAVQGADRFGNPVPAAALRPRWTSLQPSVAVADSTGLVRVVGAGEVVVEASAGTARARAYLRAEAGSERFPVKWSGHYPYVRRFYAGGGRLLAAGSETYRATTYSLTYGFSGAEWAVVGGTGTDPGVRVRPVRRPGRDRLRHRQLPGVRLPAGRPLARGLPPGRLAARHRRGEHRLRPPEERVPHPQRRGAARRGQAHRPRLPRALRAHRGGRARRRRRERAVRVHRDGDAALERRGVVRGRARRRARLPGARGARRGRRRPRGAGPQRPVRAAAGARGAHRQPAGRARRDDYRDGVVYRTPAGWREHRFTEEWSSVTAVWAAEDGSVWVSAYRATGEMTYYGERHELVMLRIRARTR